MKKFSIQNNKGGVGKSQTALNLAYALSQQGFKTLIIDIDPQANVTKTLLENCSYNNIKMAMDLKNKYDKLDTDNKFMGAIKILHEYVMQPKFKKDISDVFKDPTCIREAIQHTSYLNLDILPSTNRLATTDAEIKMSGKNVSGRLRRAINFIENDYTFVVMDNTPFENALTYNSLTACANEGDTIIIPVKIDEAGIAGLDATMQTLLEWLETEPLQYDFKILLTMVNRNSIDRAWVNTIKYLFKDRVFESTIRYQSKPVTEASLHKKILIEDINSNVAMDYQNFCNEVISSL